MFELADVLGVVPIDITANNLDKYEKQICWWKTPEDIFSAGFMHLLGILHPVDVAADQRSREYQSSTAYKLINSSRSNL
jgi:hypothetical protein